MKETLREALRHKILLLDGATGSVLMHGNNDELCLTEPERVRQLHRSYLEAGADIISTNTFCSQRTSQVEYHFDDRIAELNRAGARLAIEEARRMTALTPSQPRYVLGDVGPTNKMLSMNDEGGITFDELESIYTEQIQALLEEGVDGILVETIFDTLNAKAAISAYEKAEAAVCQQRKEQGAEMAKPEILLSMTINDASGRTLSGQTAAAFVMSVLHVEPLSVGLNCGLGADGMVPYLREMAAMAPCYVSCHPNAGLPNQFGKYDDTPMVMRHKMQVFLDESLANIIGGCCGTTPAHIAEMRQMIDASAAAIRQPKPRVEALWLSGLEHYAFAKKDFVRVGERCNVAGSRKFLRLINEKKYEEALDIARKQIADGAMAIDVNMDDGLLDARQEMHTFLKLLMDDPDICRVPIMVDSSRFEVIEEGLKCCQGKCIVNSISLKMGEAEFLRNARIVKRLGAAVIVMCFDEEGQATDYERRIAICQRAYRLLVDEIGFSPNDIIFDPNVLTVATGMEEHANYANDFIRATRWITEHLPGARVSGGLSNLSFAFRGNNYVREAMHAVFLHLAVPSGMGMAIMNPATAMDYFSIPAELALAITEVLLNLYPEASEQLVQLAETAEPEKPKPAKAIETIETIGTITTIEATPSSRLTQALIKGGSTTLEADIMELIKRGETPLQIISGPLMEGMNQVGELFGAGKMFLPQVVKTARTMKKAVNILSPFMEQTDKDTSVSPKAGKILIATVKGDVHDIGKNIVAVILTCNNFEVIDLSVMVPKEQIIETAIKEKVDIVCLSGLITPSLEEMCQVAEGMEQAGLHIPIMVGGATTSALHTAMKIAPLYHGGVFHMRDAATNPVFALRLLDPALHDMVLAENAAEQQRLRTEQSQKSQNNQSAPNTPSTPLSRRFSCDWQAYQPAQPPFIGARLLPSIPISELLPLINWKMFYFAWKVKGDTEEGQKLRADADTWLQRLAANAAYNMRCMQAFYPAQGADDHIKITLRQAEHDAGCPCCNRVVTLPTPRQNFPEGICKSLCDYVSPLGGDHIGLFAATVSQTFIDRLEAIKQQQGNSDYDALLLQTLGDRLVEAASEYLHRQIHWSGIRPAIGYPCLPDQKAIFRLAEMIDFSSIGITLTENGAMYPQASVCGLYIGHPQSEYFPT